MAFSSCPPLVERAPKVTTLMNLHMIADDGGFADDDTRTMVDEEIFADGCPRIDIDAGDAVRMLGHHAGENWSFEQIQSWAMRFTRVA